MFARRWDGVQRMFVKRLQRWSWHLTFIVMAVGFYGMYKLCLRMGTWYVAIFIGVPVYAMCILAERRAYHKFLSGLDLKRAAEVNFPAPTWWQYFRHRRYVREIWTQYLQRLLREAYEEQQAERRRQEAEKLRAEMVSRGMIDPEAEEARREQERLELVTGWEERYYELCREKPEKDPVSERAFREAEGIAFTDFRRKREALLRAIRFRKDFNGRDRYEMMFRKT